MLTNEEFIQALPGEEFAREGLQDWLEGRETEASLLLEIAAPRLRRVGLVLPPTRPTQTEAEFRLYKLLEERCGDAAYSQYNALLGRLRRFNRALENRAKHYGVPPTMAYEKTEQEPIGDATASLGTG